MQQRAEEQEVQQRRAARVDLLGVDLDLLALSFGIHGVVAAATENMRSMDLYKPPGVAETLDWTEALVALGAKELDEALIYNRKLVPVPPATDATPEQARQALASAARATPVAVACGRPRHSQICLTLHSRVQSPATIFSRIGWPSTLRISASWSK